MYIKRFPKKDDTTIYICMAVPGTKKRKTVEIVGSYNELLKKYGSEELVEVFLKNRVKELESNETNSKRESISIKIDLNKRINLDNIDSNYVKNAGYLFIQKAYYELGIEGFLNKWKFENKSKIKYSLNDAFRLMIFSRIQEPCSKLATSRKKYDYIEDFDLSIDDLYDSLNKINDFSSQLTRKLSSQCKKELGSSDAVYYDCTNFYFEIQEADSDTGLRDYGVEKNHRPDPIVEYGLLLDGNGYPIGSSTFRGNESEKTSLIPLLNDAGEDASKAKIIVADNGLNTEDNKKAIHDTGRNYIFCQSPKQLSQVNLEPLFEEGGWQKYGNEKQVKKVKSWWIKRSNGREERLVARYDQASADFVNHTIDEQIERAKKFIENPSKLSLSNCRDGKQYIKKIVVDTKTAEIIKEKCVLELKEEEIEKERKYAGYMFYVTDIPRIEDNEDGHFDKDIRQGKRVVFEDDIRIVEIAGKRNDIEDCFRQMKTGMDARPIFVRTPEHIKAHLYTVYVALTLLMYVKNKYVPDMTTEVLLECIRKYSLCMIQGKNDIYKTGYYSNDIDSLKKAMNFDDMDRQFLDWSMVKKLISLSKCR